MKIEKTLPGKRTKPASWYMDVRMTLNDVAIFTILTSLEGPKNVE